MYGNLGNKHNQEVIRQLNPQPKEAKTLIHCKLLLKDPNACNHVPIGGGKFGVCKKNPYHPDNIRRREAILAEYPVILSKSESEQMETIGQRTDQLIEMGFIADLSQLTPTEFILASYFRNVRKDSEFKVQAQHIANEVGKMFGGDK